jgi:hypothetical protein
MHKALKTSICCGYCNCTNESVFGCDGFCAKHWIDMAAVYVYAEQRRVPIKSTNLNLYVLPHPALPVVRRKYIRLKV